MKWSELLYDDYYVEYDENQKVIRGFFLASLGVDLNNLPEELFDTCEYLDVQGLVYSKTKSQKVYVRNVVGSCYKDYSGKSWINSLMKIKRAQKYILSGQVTEGKYFYLLKRNNENVSRIKLVRFQNKLYVEKNGNHRITFYKLMYLAKLSKFADQNIDPWEKYWFYADVRDASRE